MWSTRFGSAWPKLRSETAQPAVAAARRADAFPTVRVGSETSTYSVGKVLHAICIAMIATDSYIELVPTAHGSVGRYEYVPLAIQVHASNIIRD